MFYASRNDREQVKFTDDLLTQNYKMRQLVHLKLRKIWSPCLYPPVYLRNELHRVSKNVPPSTCYNLDVHDPIMIIFGGSVTEKVGNQMMLCFPTSPILCFCITMRNQKARIQRTGALCVQHSPAAAALSTSFLLNHAPNTMVTIVTMANTPYSWTHWLQDLGSHTAAWVWVMSQKGWRNQAAGWIQAMHYSIEGKCNFYFSPFYEVVQKHKLINVKCLSFDCLLYR